jgi:hypothetical protein
MKRNKHSSKGSRIKRFDDLKMVNNLLKSENGRKYYADAKKQLAKYSEQYWSIAFGASRWAEIKRDIIARRGIPAS